MGVARGRETVVGDAAGSSDARRPPVLREGGPVRRRPSLRGRQLSPGASGVLSRSALLHGVRPGLGDRGGERHARRREGAGGVLAAQDHLSLLVERSAEDAVARVTGPMIDYLPAGRWRGDLRAHGGARHPHRVADRHRGGLLPRRGWRLRPHARRAPSGRRKPRCAEDRLRYDAEEPASAIRRGPWALRRSCPCDNLPHNGRVTRGDVDGASRACPTPRSPSGSRSPSRSRTEWSTASRPRRPTGNGASCARSGASRTRRRGLLRGLPAMGARGRLPSGPSAPRGGRRHLRRGT